MDQDEIADMFAGLGPVTVRRMFGGKGIYHGGLIVAIELRDAMMLKADAVSAPVFAAAGCTQWCYEGRSGQPVLMPYWSIPDAAFDDPDEMARWVRLGDEAARRAGPAKGSAKRSAKRPAKGSAKVPAKRSGRADR